MTGVNVPLLLEAVEWVEKQAVMGENTELHWRQGAWIEQDDCGTACCVAGYVAIRVDPVFRYSHFGWVARNDLNAQAAKSLRETSEVRDGMVHASDVAMDALGLNAWQADRLFDANNSPARIRELAEGFISGETFRTDVHL